MAIKKPIVQNWDKIDRFYFSEIKDEDLLSAQNIALSSDPNNTLKIDKEGLLCLPSYFILGSGRFEEDMAAYKKPFNIIFPCYKYFSREQLKSISKQYQIFVRFNSYLACKKTNPFPQNITHCLYEPYGNQVEPSSLLHPHEGYNIKPASYQEKRNIIFNIVKRADNEEMEYAIFSINNEIYPLKTDSFLVSGVSFAYLAIENLTSIATPFKHFYEYELFAVKKS
ncbi:hypothetical protein GASC598I20_023590 [Gilliamella apicola SCGC AB-598-I20]|nr:hypothetical protein GASC598I20_023590 [Gilliamella apicola SCGC AB-598-I20]